VGIKGTTRNHRRLLNIQLIGVGTKDKTDNIIATYIAKPSKQIT